MNQNLPYSPQEYRRPWTGSRTVRRNEQGADIKSGKRYFSYTVRSANPDGSSALTEDELMSAGVHCDPDSRRVLEDAEVVRRVGNAYELSKPARKFVSTFTLAKGPEAMGEA